MNKIHEWVNTGLIVLVAILVLVGGGNNQPEQNVGGSTSATWTAANLVSNGTLSVTGASTLTGALGIGGGTSITKAYHGTCDIVSDSSITATTTGTGTCTTTGSIAGDRVFVELATTTTKMSAQFMLAGVVAGTDSTTIRIVNLTGTDATPGALSGWGSSTKYWIVR